jgi:hypothetical protein
MMVITTRDLLTFSAVSIARYSNEHMRTNRFGNWICFRPHVMGGRHLSTELDTVSETTC